MNVDLFGRTAVVTGTSGGIGLAIANALADSGAVVHGLSRTGAVKEGERPSHPGVRHLKADLLDYPALAGTIERIAAGDGLDILVNNAGATARCRAEEFLDEDFDHIHNLNVKSVFKLSCLCYRRLKASPHVGRIINIASMAAHLGFSEVVPYCSSKGAVLAMTRGLAVEWARDNITVNSISPGWFPSNMTRKVMDGDRRAKILARMPLHAFGDPADLGSLAAYLVSDAARYITGQDFAVDGGALAFGF
ncbi:MAG: SDR family oxidoreductase [Planctomycetota bacterium]|jgi:NAD(P)-dependent dehydrogenase (short-subunit alcohol dehydrogenase family)|nr:SDR family oxidoreductase [Planctomycetota bacterium]